MKKILKPIAKNIFQIRRKATPKILKLIIFGRNDKLIHTNLLN